MHDIKTITLGILGGLKSVFIDSWLTKLVITALSAAFINNALLIVLVCLLVAIDTISKQFVLVTAYVAWKDQKTVQEVTKGDIFRNFFNAVHPNYINSKGFKGIALKIILYGCLILIALFLEQSPKKVIFGVDALKTLADGIFVAIVCTEFYSILENFRDMGSKLVDRLQSLVSMIFERLGGKWSANINIEQKKEDERKNG